MALRKKFKKLNRYNSVTRLQGRPPLSHRVRDENQFDADKKQVNSMDLLGICEGSAAPARRRAESNLSQRRTIDQVDTISNHAVKESKFLMASKFHMNQQSQRVRQRKQDKTPRIQAVIPKPADDPNAEEHAQKRVQLIKNIRLNENMLQEKMKQLRLKIRLN